MAQRQNADTPRLVAARPAEEEDSPKEIRIEEWAELMEARGMPRRAALQAANDIWDREAKDDGAAGQIAHLGHEAVTAPMAEGGAGMAWLKGHDGASKLLQALSQIWAWPDSRKGLGALFFAMGAPLYGCSSMRALAKLRGVSVEDVSNVVDELQRILGLPRNTQQKSEAAVKAYKRTNGALARTTEE